MEFNLDPQSLIKILAEVTRCEVTQKEGLYQLALRSRYAKDTKFDINSVEIEQLIESIRAKDVYDETTLYDDVSCEVFVKEESSVRFRRFREERLEVKENENGLTYELSQVSNEYLIWLLARVSKESSLIDYGLGTVIASSRVERMLAEPDKQFSIFDFIRLISPSLISLKIRATTKISVKRFTQLIYAFLFQIGYNLDIAFVPQRSLEDMSRRGRITRMRRSSKINEIEPPRRLYNDDLIHHYLLAVSTDNPVIEFLSYYHVLEHFFEAVFNDALIERVRSHITHPAFSYKRKKDVTQLVNLVKKSLQIRSETITFSESEALRLCLVRFVSLTELVDKLDEYDSHIVDYYRTNNVPFSEGATVDLRNMDTEQVLRQLTKRIYSTRNALVHSKENEMSRYTPFVDERALHKEVPLMRFISEMVILSESTVL